MVAGLTRGLPLPVVNSPVKQISESLGVWCPACPWLPLDRLSGCVCQCTKLSALLSSSVTRHPPWTQSPVVADSPDVLGVLSLTWVTSPRSELCVFMFSIQHGYVSQSRVLHLFFPGEDVLLIHSAYGKNSIAQWITTGPVWNLEGVLEIKKTVYLPPSLTMATVIFVLIGTVFLAGSARALSCLSSHHSEPG